MFSKNNYEMNKKKQAEKLVRYGIRKLNIGAAMVAVSAALFFAGGSAQAAGVENNSATEEAPKSDKASGEETTEVSPKEAKEEVEPSNTAVNESSTEGKDISNDLKTTITLTHDNDPVVVDSGNSLSAGVTFEIEKVKAGDRFSVKFSDELDLAGIARPKEFETNLWIEDSIKLAAGRYNPESNTVDYVVTKEAEVLRNIKVSKSYYVAINRDVVKDSETIRPTISVGDKKETFSVPVKYAAVDRARGGESC